MLTRRSKSTVVQGQVDKVKFAEAAIYFDAIGKTPRSMSELVRLIVHTFAEMATNQAGITPIRSIEHADWVLEQVIRNKYKLEDDWS